jgi:hypothetical protein
MTDKLNELLRDLISAQDTVTDMVLSGDPGRQIESARRHRDEIESKIIAEYNQAILRERERCAAIAEKWQGEPLLAEYRAVEVCACKGIAAAIREGDHDRQAK